MRIRKSTAPWSLALATLLTLAATALASAGELAPGERIVFLGDSITQAGAGPNGYVTMVRKAIDEKFPDKDIEVIGAGISGNKVTDLQRRLEKDVLAKKPTIVIIYIGINDVWHSLRDRGTSKEDFEAGLKSIIEKINGVGAKVILSTPSVIGEKTDGSNQLDKMLDEYADISRQVAKETDSQLLDLRKAFLSQLAKSNADQKERGVLTTDGVHLNEQGNEFVADQMLAALTGQKGTGVLRHVVLFSFKEGTTPETVAQIEKAFAALPSKIDVIKDFEWGTDVSVENLADGFTHAFFVTFENEQGRATYLPHPAHQEFVSLVKPNLEKVLVIDYWAK